MRALALMVACEGHPLLVPRVRRYLDHELNLRDTQQAAWRRHWTVETLAALEAHLAGDNNTGRFCHGDAPTMADCCLVPQIFNAQRYQCDTTPYPATMRVFAECMKLDAFERAQPARQPDAE